MPWSCGWRMTGSAVMASAVIEKRLRAGTCSAGDRIGYELDHDRRAAVERRRRRTNGCKLERRTLRTGSTVSLAHVRFRTGSTVVVGIAAS